MCRACALRMGRREQSIVLRGYSAKALTWAAEHRFRAGARVSSAAVVFTQLAAMGQLDVTGAHICAEDNWHTDTPAATSGTRASAAAPAVTYSIAGAASTKEHPSSSCQLRLSEGAGAPHSAARDTLLPAGLGTYIGLAALPRYRKSPAPSAGAAPRI
jgi:hypothetical protein